MPAGYHHFFAYSATSNYGGDNPYAYFIGGFTGDHANDYDFKMKLSKILSILEKKYGFGNFSYCWSPIRETPYQPRTNEERFQTAMKKAENRFNKKVAEIKKQHSLFTDDFIQEERNKLTQYQDVLKKRYSIG